MALPKSPFASSSSLSGHGSIVLSLIPPARQVLAELTYQYPLKLIAPDPHTAEGKHVTLAFLLTYGGGLVGGDQIKLKIKLENDTRLVLVTQGSTKLFKSPSRSVVTRQQLDVDVGKGASLCYLPDPTQPFAESVYEQRQNFHVQGDDSSVCILDWVNEGRRARGESWTLWSWKGRNEVRELDASGSGPGRLLLRDAVMLNDEKMGATGLCEKTNGMGVFGTLILYGPTFQLLDNFFMDEFSNLPKLGAKNWAADGKRTEAEEKMQARLEQEKHDGLLWTVARRRGSVVVKFCSHEVDGARRWLHGILKREGSIEKVFGPQALIGLR